MRPARGLAPSESLGALPEWNPRWPVYSLRYHEKRGAFTRCGTLEIPLALNGRPTVPHREASLPLHLRREGPELCIRIFIARHSSWRRSPRLACRHGSSSSQSWSTKSPTSRYSKIFAFIDVFSFMALAFNSSNLADGTRTAICFRPLLVEYPQEPVVATLSPRANVAPDPVSLISAAFHRSCGSPSHGPE